MRNLAWLALVAACGGGTTPHAPGPIVSSLMPQSGTWGTEVTIDGVHFGGVPGMSSVVAFDSAVGANGFVVDSWTDTRIKGRIAFPGTGGMYVQTPAGSADIGSFTTTMPYQPSMALDVAQLASSLVLSTGSVAAVYRSYELAPQATLADFGASKTYALAGVLDPNDASAPIYAQLVEADDHTPEVIATRTDGTVAVFGTAGTADTGLSGTVLAAARDATGVYAWIDTTSGLVRARPGTTWTVDRGPITTAHSPLSGAVAGDGTLWLTVEEPAGAGMGYVSLQTLAPTDTQLGALERVDPAAHADPMPQPRVLVASDGIHALVTAATARLRTAASTWSDAPAMAGLVDYAFAGTTLTAVVNDASAKTTSFVSDVTMPASAQVIPVWPMLSQGFALDAAGKVHPLIDNGNVTYALTPP
ncbi:MAG: IPT/TIG domain-containing protein [Acidobacteriota bacterium]